MLKCPVCNSEDIVYIQTVKEWWAVERIEEDGYVELSEVKDTFVMEGVPEKLYCYNCEIELTIKEYIDKKKALGLKN